MVSENMVARFVASAAVLGFAVCLSSPALAQDGPAEGESPITIEGSYKADLLGVAAGGVERGWRGLDNLNVTAQLDLDALAGWRGGTFFVNVLNNFGGRPNDLAGTIQGVDNIEVADTRIKVYEAWVEQAFGDVSLRAGLYDLNSEFYQNDTAGLLIAPPFGIGSELSATGPNGPSIFPSTALAARLNVDIGNAYVRGAVVNAKAGTIGDYDGVDVFGREGVLLIGEAGWTGKGKFAVGVWRYSKEQPLIDGTPNATDVAQGLYAVIEHELFSTASGATASGFLRAGLSDGHTSPFEGGWQLGLLVDRPFASRPASSFSLGVGGAWLSRSYRESVVADVPGIGRSEAVVELTYKDEILPGLSLQPDIQYVINPAADPSLRNALILGLRVQFDFKLK